MKSVDVSNSKNWIRFKPSLCRSCWATCCHDMSVQVSVRDLVRLELITEEEAAGSLGRAVGRLKRKKILKSLEPGALIYLLEQKKNLDCQFLDERRRCTVYAKRPEICRQFPKIGPKPGHCPYSEKDADI